MRRRSWLGGVPAAAAVVALTMLMAARARAEVIKLEPDIVRSEITATVTEPLSRFRDNPTATGTFRILSGEITGDPRNPATTGKVKLVIDATTYDSGSQMRDKNVLGSTLETSQYPSIEFDSTGLEDVQIVPQGDGGDATVVGNLSLHGVTRSIRVPVEASLDTDGEFIAWGKVSLDYTDYGIKPPRLLFALAAAKEVTISFRIKARKPGAPQAPTPTPTPTGPSFWDEFVNKVLK